MGKLELVFNKNTKKMSEEEIEIMKRMKKEFKKLGIL